MNIVALGNIYSGFQVLIFWNRLTVTYESVGSISRWTKISSVCDGPAVDIHESIIRFN